MVAVKVNPGVCGLNTTIKAESEDMEVVRIDIDSQCPHITAMGDLIKELDGYTECFAKLGSGDIYKAANQKCKHAACPVPSAMVKAVEVACGLALPADVSFTVLKD